MADAFSPLRAFVESDGDLRDLEGRQVAVIGYGNQGRAQALNLRDSGVPDIIVGTLVDETWDRAKSDGFAVRSVPVAARAGQVILLLIPDEELPDVFEDQIAPFLDAGDAVVFASGYGLAFGGVDPPPGVDALLLAPRMIGRKVRELYERGEGFYSYVCVERDASGRSWPTLLALAKGIGSLRAGAFELRARDEAVLDLFHEQGFGSLLGMTMFLMFEVGVEGGLAPEALALDLYLSGEAAETLRAMAEEGFFEQSRLHSLTSQYGGMMRSLALDAAPLRGHLSRILAEVRSGEFARQWSAERAANYENFQRLREVARAGNPFTPVEQRIRDALEEARRRAASRRPGA